MPRITRIPAILSTRGSSLSRPGQTQGPRLWNAKRRIKSSKGLTPRQYEQYLKDPLKEDWRTQVSEDVVQFIDGRKLLPEEKAAILRNPSRYFSRPYHVPESLRKQVYFPTEPVVLMRTPHLPPRYAAFDVPLDFNKLDMKSYLKQAYNVDVVHIRSTVIQQKVQRKPTSSPYSQGRLFRPKSKKKMTVQLVEPFIWPEPIKDLSPWEKSTFDKQSKAFIDENREQSQWSMTHPNEQHRKSIAQQAKDLLQGKATWKPTWQSLPLDARVMQGKVTAPPS